MVLHVSTLHIFVSKKSPQLRTYKLVQSEYSSTFCSLFHVKNAQFRISKIRERRKGREILKNLLCCYDDYLVTSFSPPPSFYWSSLLWLCFYLHFFFVIYCMTFLSSALSPQNLRRFCFFLLLFFYFIIFLIISSLSFHPFSHNWS